MWKRCRSTAKRYPGDNRLILPKSPYRRQGLAPRCRLVASWGWSRSQGLGCSPIKAVRELGSERRETVRSLSVAGVWTFAGRRPQYETSHPQEGVRPPVDHRVTWAAGARPVTGAAERSQSAEGVEIYLLLSKIQLSLVISDQDAIHLVICPQMRAPHQRRPPAH